MNKNSASKIKSVTLRYSSDRETILLKAMRAAHAVKVEDLLIRLNEIRKNGELNGIEKIPTLARIPVYHQPPAMTVPAVPPPQVTVQPPVQTMAPSISADPPHPDPAAEQTPSDPPSPVVEQSVSIPEPVPAPVAEPGVPAAEPVSVAPPEEKMTESVPASELHNNQPVMEKDKDVTEPVTEIPELPVAATSDEDAGEEIAEPDSQEMPEELPAALEERNGMSLKERFSAELLWSKLTETILQFQPSVGSVMSGGVADRIENSMMYVNFDARDDVMIYQIVTKAKNMLVQELRKLTGDRFADITLGLKEGIRTPAVPKRTLEELKRDVSSNPMVRETADLFAGSIVDVME